MHATNFSSAHPYPEASLTERAHYALVQYSPCASSPRVRRVR